MKLFFKILLSAFLVFVLVVGGGIFYLARGLEEGSVVEINEVNPSALADGTYNGQYKAGRWTNELQVTVKSGKITSINIVKDVTFSKPEWTKELFDRVIQKQGTNVDVVSGATVTCKAYIKAIEDALNK